MTSLVVQLFFVRSHFFVRPEILLVDPTIAWSVRESQMLVVGQSNYVTIYLLLDLRQLTEDNLFPLLRERILLYFFFFALKICWLDSVSQHLLTLRRPSQDLLMRVLCSGVSDWLGYIITEAIPVAEQIRTNEIHQIKQFIVAILHQGPSFRDIIHYSLYVSKRTMK